jgi:hypothetical protein
MLISEPCAKDLSNISTVGAAIPVAVIVGRLVVAEAAVVFEALRSLKSVSLCLRRSLSLSNLGLSSFCSPRPGSLDSLSDRLVRESEPTR